MYKIKQKPEDFFVKEVMDLKFDKEGKYVYYLLKKKDYTTQKAMEVVSRHFRIPLKYINYAGNKDKRAVTEQFISVSNGPERNLELKDVKVEYLGRGKERINLGTLKGNKFEIVVRNISRKPKKIDKIVNYFDEQRFGVNKNNHLIGKLIVKRYFKKALDVIGVEKRENYVSALREIPRRILRIYVHAYQSFLWNKTASLFLKKYKENKNIKIPIIGFGSEFKNNNIKEIIDNILKKEKIGPRDFIIREIPELSAEGDERYLFAKIKNLKIEKLQKDDLNKGKKCTVNFYLPKGSYATIAIKTMLS